MYFPRPAIQIPATVASGLTRRSPPPTSVRRLTQLALSGALALAVVAGGPARAEPPGPLIELSDDMSRGELFTRFVAPQVGMRSLARTFTFPGDAEKDGNKPRSDTFGIDISHHNESRCNCKIDWATFRDHKVSFVYLKATQGARYFDKTFERNWNAIGKLAPEKRLWRGAYHFLSSDVDPAEQARHFLRVMPKLGAGDMAPCLDLEWDMQKSGNDQRVDAWERVPKAEIARRALIWLREVKAATGKTPIIYTNRAWWAERIGEDRAADFKEFPIWIADYSASRRAVEMPAVMKNTEWALWQFSEDARVTINGGLSQVDANIFKGPVAEFKKKLGIVD